MSEANLITSDETLKDDQKLTDKYEILFPPLLKEECAPVPLTGQWTQKLTIKPVIIKQGFYIFAKDRKYLIEDREEQRASDFKVCSKIARKTGAYIKITSSEDQNLNFVIVGEKETILETQWLILEEFAKQKSVVVPFPKEHHPFILGKYGELLIYLQLVSVTRILVPPLYDNSNFIVIIGIKDGIDKAAHEIELITDKQGFYITIPIPKNHYTLILEKIRKKLAYWELAIVSKIAVLHTDDKSDKVMLKISGTTDGLEKARSEIELILKEQAKVSVEHLRIPKIYHPFICGPFNDIVDQIMYETDTTICMPIFSKCDKDLIIINGTKETVALAKQKILKIYEEKRRNCVVVSRKLPKSQHKYVLGSGGKTIAEILAESGVLIEIPPADSSSEIITLRGEQSKLHLALSLLQSKVQKSIL